MIIARKFLALVYEFLFLFQSLSLARFNNLIRLLFYYFLARKNNKIINRAFPYALSVEPTTSCNLHCPECPSGMRSFVRPAGNMSMDLFRKIIKESYRELIYLTLYFQGEPFLNPQFFKMLEYATQKKIFTATSSNAHFISPENAQRTVKSGLKKLIISLDGITQEVYSQYRKGGNIERVLEGVKNIVAAKRELKSHSPIVVLQFIVFRHNEHQIANFIRLAKALKVDYYELKSAQIYDFKQGNALIPSKEQYSRYRLEGAGYRIKSDLPNHCWRMWHSPVITQSGDLVPCCFDKQAEYAYGNIRSRSFAQIWQSKEAELFRQRVFTQRSQFDICRNCTEGLK